MPLPFALVCDLLEPSYKLSVSRKSNAHVVAGWFTRHRDRVNAHDANLGALLSTLLPEKRTDRVYCIQVPTLEKIIGRAFFLGASRIAELSQYRQPGSGVDLADCVTRLLTVTPNPSFDKQHQVTVEEIDEILQSLASRVKWSSPAIRSSQATLTQGNRGDLEKVYRRLNANEAKWFTRLILKDYQPLLLDPHLIYRLCDPILPSVLKVQDDFSTAINTVQAIRSRLLPTGARKTSRERILSFVKPQLGVKVGRQPWMKGRSIKHSLDMGHGRMSVEEKMDGEYCQIHIDLSKGDQCVQIFSKSGKDSTEDRQALHGIILESLKIGQGDARVTKGCILEGELLVYDDSEQRILPFHKVRKHVSRRGRFLNTEQDSLPGPHEHLMIVYYDLLLLDDQSLINVRHSERFKLLSSLIYFKRGWAELVQREVIDFDHNLGASNLRKVFARTILGKKEGLVLKPDDPYFDFSDLRRPFSSCCIKLKKEYIGNFGDVGDFAVVGARYDPVKARGYRIADLKWTHFYLGCLDNREQVKRWNAKPEFTVVNVVELNETMLRDVVTYANPMPVPSNENTHLELKLTPGVEQGMPLAVVFTNPLVFDLKCFSFDKVGNTGFWSLRFPSVTKVHCDRDYTDTVSFEQLQEMAKDATTAKVLEDSQENLQWIAKLEGADPRGVAVDAISQLTMTTMPTPSPRRSSQASTVAWTPTSPVAARLLPIGLESPCHDRFAGTRPLPAVTNVTNATMSAPTIQTNSPTDRHVSHKRISPPAKPSSPHKRQKLKQTLTQTTAQPTQKQTSSQTRKPLTDINGNSQSDPSSFSSIPLCNLQLLPEVIDLTSSPEASFTTATTSKFRSSQIPRPTSPMEDTTDIIILDIEIPDSGIPDSEDQRVADKELSFLRAEEYAAHSQTPEQAESQSVAPLRTSCRYSGSACRFVKTVILIAADILDTSAEAKSLLHGHGILDPIEDLDGWLEREKARTVDDQHWEPRPNTLLLVDSVGQQAETKALLASVEERRASLPEDRRDWVTIYDWRVLKYVTIMEDENVTRKYYDGWHDPWRRWYCGIV
ncbi:hypothetical protein BGZ61DRAFT_162963 [Ilyonectria robusta]|uniref:uncharacterized protein n=1 Tax=Ilyonectria robusta TaxID=1079257 RepID=UPI001E8E2F8D|nr:uncharacterized protein BGZ61DRAFT_162963 [Ilyonectria robusta]KAH8733583.1 hypothetical protein BGZ61DRAFT_162963 [Ilyonectria robusta]